MRIRHSQTNGFTFLETLVIFSVLGILTAILLPVFSRTHCDERRATCQSNLRRLAVAFSQYAQDYEGRLPLRAVSAAPGTAPLYAPPFGWADGIHSYSRDNALLHCPTASGQSWNGKGLSSNPRLPGFTDYWFNAGLSGKSLSKMSGAGTTFLLGDGNAHGDRNNARYSRSFMPPSWLAQGGPAGRHQDGANYCFIDGHVKYLKAEMFIHPQTITYSFVPAE